MKSIVNVINFTWHSRRAWLYIATARTKARFSRTFFGSFWLGLSNLLSIAALSLVYGAVFKVDNFSAYVVYLGIGLVTWGLIASSITSAGTLFEANSKNILNNNTHPVFYTLEEWAFQLQTFAQSFVLVVLVLALIKPVLLLHLFGPALLPLINLLLFVYWLPLLICLLGANYRDFYQLIPIGMQLVFLVSPILYQKKSLGTLSWLATYNPFYRILDGVRTSMIDGQVNLFHQSMLLVVNILGVLIGWTLLEGKRKELPFLF